MLTVVGASIVQTKVSTYVLAALALVGLFVIIFGGEISTGVENDGTYSASVFWNSKDGYHMEFWGQGNVLEEIPKGSARAYYRPDISVNGWSKVEIETNEDFPDWVQAYSAGLLEGSLTWQMIHWHWQNTVKNICDGIEEHCSRVREHLRLNSKSIRTKAVKLSEVDPYWHQVSLFYAQMDGIETGWRYAVKRSRQSFDIPSEDFLWMNVGSDLIDIARKFDFSFDKNEMKSPSLTSAFVKLCNASSEPHIYVAHNTADMYRNMLRTIKRYEFKYHFTSSATAKLILGTAIIFTGYPGVISSQDDFYVISGSENGIQPHNLTVTGTPINNFNPQLWNKVIPEDQVLTSARVMVANRLASCGRAWSRYFSRTNSGTGNKQWVVLDFGRLTHDPSRKPGKPEGLLWIIEQIPGLIYGSDQSHILHKYGYWANFGLAFYEDIRAATNVQDAELSFGNLYSYTKSPKAQLFAQCKSKCNSLDNILYMMRQGLQQPDADLIGARGDLYTQQPIAYGLIDTKVFIGKANRTLDLQITSGPVFSNKSVSGDISQNEIDNEMSGKDANVLPFQWSTSIFKDVPHHGQPDIWEFSPLRPEWVWN